MSQWNWVICLVSQFFLSYEGSAQGGGLGFGAAVALPARFVHPLNETPQSYEHHVPSSCETSDECYRGYVGDAKIPNVGQSR